MSYITIKEENPDKVRREIDKIKTKDKELNIAVLGRDIEFNRKILEMKKVNMLVLNHKDKKDKLKERDSGLNQVLCKIAKQNSIIIAFDFNETLSSRDFERAEILGRWIQNIKLLKKFKVDVALINKSLREDYDLRAFLLTLGASTDFTKMMVERAI